MKIYAGASLQETQIGLWDIESITRACIEESLFWEKKKGYKNNILKFGLFHQTRSHNSNIISI